MIEWKKGVDWHGAVLQVEKYYADHPDLKFGQSGVARVVISHLCANGTVSQKELIEATRLASADDVMTILSNVTMALGSGSVPPPTLGGWYVSFHEPTRYLVSPGFAAAWLKLL